MPRLVPSDIIIIARRTLTEAEKSLAKSTEDLKKALKSSERKVKELEKELHKGGRESSESHQRQTFSANALPPNSKMNEINIKKISLSGTTSWTRPVRNIKVGLLSPESLDLFIYCL